MKKVLSIMLSILSIFLFCACGVKEIDEEIEKILNYIPSEMIDDLELPTSNSYEVSYSIDGEDVGTIIKYEILNSEGQVNYEDSQVILDITLKSETEEAKRQKTITRIYSQEKHEDYLNHYCLELIEEYLELLPACISSDFSLPEKFIYPKDVIGNVSFSSPLERKGNTFIYNYPSESGQFKVTMSLSCDEIDVSQTKVIPILSKEQKNSVPRIYLTVDGKITKEEYLEGSFDLEVKEDGEWIKEKEALEMKIKGRGNSTWGFDKKPYKIKFSSKQSFFNEKEAKTWTLIANYIDHSLLRNYSVYFLGRSLDGLDHTTCGYFVDVYLNNEYMGNYLLCEQVEVDKNRLNIKAKNDNEGFLIELDQKYFDSNEGVEGIDYFYSKLHGDNWLFAMQEPDPEDITKEKVTRVKAYLDEAIAALKANTDNMYNYFDLNSVVDSFIVNELTKNKDVGWSSFFLHKDGDGKICFGPLWDYDLSCMGQGNITRSERSPEGWFSETSYKNPFYDYFLRNEKFKKAVKERFNEIKDNQLKDMIDELYRAKDYIYYSAEQNFNKWKVIGKETGWWISDEEHNITTWQGQVELLINYYIDRINWMDKELAKW